MSIFTDSERLYLTETRAITTDEQGQEVLVGLTLQETIFYREYAKNIMDGEHSPDDGARYLELHEKHERVRLGIVVAEVELRSCNPQIH